jgi:hypothetical protein
MSQNDLPLSNNPQSIGLRESHIVRMDKIQERSRKKKLCQCVQSLGRHSERSPDLFVHRQMGIKPMMG